MPVMLHEPFEVTLTSSLGYANPLREMPVPVVFTSPSGTTRRVSGFWDGGPTWRIRFRPDEVGEWTWRTEVFNSADTGLLLQSGRFTCTHAAGTNAFQQHGPLRSGQAATYLSHQDGTPFFWLADTCWNGALLSTDEDWEEYLAIRQEQGFTAIQVVMTQWRADTAGVDGQPVFTVEADGLHVNAAAFQRLEARLRAINEHGMLAAPVMLWALTPADPGQTLSETDAALLCKYMRARWDAFQVAYILGGDGHYQGEQAARWQRLGRAVFPDTGHPPVTIHPCGCSWVVAEFHGEPWLDFHGYQSGHGDSVDHLRWHLQGPPVRPWEVAPVKPLINQEPMYEAHPSYRDQHRFGPREVRRAAYWSLLLAPTAGVTYGHNWVWPWPVTPQVPEGHESLGEVRPWPEGVRAPGAQSMSVLRRIMARLEWWRLRPAIELLAVQPGETEPRQWIAAAATADRDLAVLYLPTGGEVRLNTGGTLHAEWVDPRTGAATDAGAVTASMTAPDGQDWLLICRA